MLNNEEAVLLLRSIVSSAGGTLSEEDLEQEIVLQIRLRKEISVPLPRPFHNVPDPKSRYRVLHVEDTDRASDLIYYYLRDKYEVETAQTAQEAMDLATRTRYDYVLMDLNLGKGMDGIELTEIFRKFEHYKKIPIIAITGYSSKKDIERSIEAGCNDFISKPFLKDDLLRMMHHFEKLLEGDGKEIKEDSGGI